VFNEVPLAEELVSGGLDSLLALLVVDLESLDDLVLSGLGGDGE
jgi:hypothetical protein